MAGAGYKLFNTGEVLTAAQVNTYLNEQTVMVFASSAARTSALSGVLADGMVSYLQDTNAVEVYNGSAWVGVGNVGDITEVQAGVGISVASGTGPIPVMTNSSTDLITTAGDLLYGTAADTVARLGIGTAGQVLKVNSGATAPEWGAAAAGGGMTLLSTTTVSASSTITLSSISQDYIHLQVILDNPTVSAQNGIRFRFNGDSNTRYRNTADPLDTNNTFNSDFMRASGTIGTTGAVSCSIIDIPSYTNTYSYKYSQYCYFGKEATTTNAQIEGFANIYNQIDAITSLTFFVATGNFSGTIRLYGVK